MDFVWNAPLAEQVRAASERAMEIQAGNMDRAAGDLIMQASRVDADANRLYDSLPIYREVPVTRTKDKEREGDDGVTYLVDVSYECIDLIEDKIATARAHLEVDRMRKFADKLREEAKTLSDEARVLLEKKARTNALYDELFRMAQETDGRYAEHMAAIWAQIQRYLTKIQGIRDSIGMTAPCGGTSIGGILINDGTFVLFPQIRELLSRPTDRITPAQFDILARTFVKIGDDVGATERFLNYMATRVDLPENQHWPYGAFTVCPQKILEIQVRIEAGIAIALETQFEYIRQGGDPMSPNITSLTDQRKKLMERSALLTVVADIASVPLRSWGAPPHTVERILFADEDRPGPFTIRHNIIYQGVPPERVPAGITVTVNHGTLTRWGHGDDPRITLQSVDNGNFRGNGTVTISSASSGIGGNLGSVVLTGNYFQLLNQFDLDAFIQSKLTSAGQAAIVAAAVVATKGLGPIVAGASIGSHASKLVGTSAGLASSFSSAISSAERIQQDIGSVVDAGIAGAFLQTFELHTVFITENGRPPQPMVWTGFDSYVRFSAFNDVVDSGITWEEFLQNPEAALDVFRQAVPTNVRDNIPENVRDGVTPGYEWRLFDPNRFNAAIERNIDNGNRVPASQSPQDTITEPEQWVQPNIPPHLREEPDPHPVPIEFY